MIGNESNESKRAAVLAWLQKIIDDQPEGAYKGAYTYEDEKQARSALALLVPAERLDQ